jgi:hypothetical protein
MGLIMGQIRILKNLMKGQWRVMDPILEVI